MSGRVWRAPIAIGVVSAVGLTAALLADGAYDVLSSLALAVPVIVSSWFALGSRRREV